MDLQAPSLVAGLNITVTSAAASLLSLINTAAAASFTANTDPWQNLDGLDITPEDGNVRISFHPSFTPSSTVGRLLSSGVTYYFRFKDLDNIKLISTTAASVKCSVAVGKCRQNEFDIAAGGGGGGGSSSSSSAIGGGASTYSNAFGDFTATANNGAKTITFSAYAAGSPLSATITALNFANAVIRRTTSSGTVDTLPLTNVAFAANVLTLSDMTANFAVGDTVEVFVPGPDKSYNEASDVWKIEANAANIPTATTMQNAAVANGSGTSLNVQGYVAAILNIVSSVAMSGGTTVNFEASVDDTTWVSIVGHQVGAIGSQMTSTTSDGDYRINVAGFKSLRARISGYSAGTVTVKGYKIATPGQTTAVGISGGNVASGATDSGNPVKVGGVYNSSAPTLTNGQRGDMQLDSKGNTNVNLNTLISGENQGKNRLMTTRPGTWVRMTTATTTTHVSGTNIFSGIIVEAQLTGTVTVYDSLSASGTTPLILPIGTLAGTYGLEDGASMSTGLTVVTSAADRIVVGYALN